VEQAETAVASGAKFIVTPGFDAAVVDWCIAHNVPITPGVMTPTEINMALNKGITLVKFFPAEAAGGVNALKAIAAPYGGVTFIPTGGVSTGNLADYLSLPMVHACGGSWVATKQLINAGEFEKIEKLTAEGVKLVQQIRGK
ncbi:MAG: bifunctional 4-hydroxy-2-oxoglutarate aldolase/2-dehydro-3-deoxy-phosphogluconate aldolase, partial [Anaerolineae bacterium]|nr:bifunctional 4-hydroxy-2-oxoglutarate aldolase/2-dehydro-3-deoxy-phosphogluconate aldolase [Anaerolineae bacterium]